MVKKSSIVSSSKQAERDVAQLLGGRRLRAGEWDGKKGDADVIGPGWLAQVKHRSGVPDYIVEGMNQISEAVQGTDDLPILVLRTKPGRGKPVLTLVIMSDESFGELRWRG